jgi:pimeloyl-ACP methyl ester carboxylesterase
MPSLHLADVDLHYEVHGEGPPFLFLSQTATHGTVWKPWQVPEFARDHRVIVYDQRGTGKSPTGSSDFSTNRLAADAAALLDHVGGGPAILCGHSNGGRVAQLLTLDYADKVKALILASAGGTHKSKGIPIGMCVELVEKGYERYVREHSIEVGFTESYARAHPDQVNEIIDLLVSDITPLETFLGHVIGRQEYDATSRLKDIHVPTLVMIGEDEDHGSSHGITHLQFARQLAAAIPGAEFAMIADHGHYYPFADPEQTHRIMRDFLKRRVG